jgi:hypothetical protein
MLDLSTNYLGLVLKNPLVPSSTPLSHNIDRCCISKMPVPPPSSCTRCLRKMSVTTNG